MPKIRFINVKCDHCGAEYRVRLDKVSEGGAFECVTCGNQVALTQYVGLLKLIYQYSAMILDLEQEVTIEGDTVTPKPTVQFAPSIW